MLDALRDFIRGLGADAAPERHFGADDTRLALAALLIHLMVIDGKTTAAERAKVRDLLTREFGLSGADLDLLIEDATMAENEAVDLYRFTTVLKRSMSEDERVRVIGNLWEIAYADEASDEFEENMVWRVAELLGVNRRDRIAARRWAADSRAARRAGD